LLTTVVYVRMAAQVYVWRLAPVLIVLVQICVMRSLVSVAVGKPYDGLIGSRGVRATIIAIASVGFFLFYGYREHDFRTSLTLAVLLTMLLASLAIRRRWLPALGTSLIPLTGVIAFLAFASIGLHSLAVVKADSNLIERSRAEQALYAWARSTELDSRFLVPPEMEDFRLQARRPVVVDWKTAPFVPSELIEWYERIDAISGGTKPRSLEAAMNGYSRLGPEVLRTLSKRYSVSYVVLKKPVTTAVPEGWTVAHSSSGYLVLRVATPSGAMLLQGIYRPATLARAS
jgi:hypothetical protein